MVESRNTLEVSRSRDNLWLHRFAVLTAAGTFVLIIAGGLVTSTGSGLSVPDWPLSYGTLFPPMVGGIFYEHGHRMIAMSVGFLTVILSFWLWFKEPRRWVRSLGMGALATIVVQGVLGGLTVIYRLPTFISVTHACLAQAFFGITVSLALFTSSEWKRGASGPNCPNKLEDRGIPSLRSLSLTTTAFIYLQLLLGALVRHTGSGLAIPDFPLSFGRLVPPIFSLLDEYRTGILIHFAHRVGAGVVTMGGLWTVTKIIRDYKDQVRLLVPSLLMAGLLVIQILLGAFVIWTAKEVYLTTAHVGVGALVLASSLTLTLRSYQMLGIPERTLETR